MSGRKWAAGAVLVTIVATAWALPRTAATAAFADSLLALITFGLELSGGMSLGFLFIILSLGRLHWLETLLMANSALLLLAVVRFDRTDPLKLLRSVASTSLAALGAHAAFKFLDLPEITVPADFIFGATICFAGMNAFRWDRSILWCYPYYLVAAGLAAFSPIPAVTPVLAYAVWYAYRVYERRLNDSFVESQRISDLHMRTMQTLALAIEARDTPLNGHTRRVTVYATELAREMDLPVESQEALRVASLLYDIGELAVPEHILAKNGKLTPEEFDKIRIHPQVGAEILDRVNFPYPVSPIVLAHHERWNGSGYPKGLIGEEIPRTARILAVADTIDALTSRRSYRPEITIEEAIAYCVSESGRTFDPTIITLVERNYKQWEKRLTKSVANHFAGSILSAQNEAQTLLDLSTKLGLSLDLDHTYHALEKAVERLIPCQGMLIWTERDKELGVEHAMGETPATWKSLRMPEQSGLSGEAAFKQVVVTGFAARDFDPAGVGPASHSFQYALSAPLRAGDKAGALTLYSTAVPFSAEHTRILGLIAPKLSAALSNGLKFRQVTTQAGVDALTGLPNAAALSQRMSQLTGEWAVVVCDLDGFKAVNDTFGHVTGNRVLEAAGEGFRAGCRGDDFVARLGGDEFVLLLNGVSSINANSRLMHFETMIRQVGQAVTGKEVIAGSFGVAFFPSEGTLADEILAKADQRMYQKKGERSKALPNLSNHLLSESRRPLPTQ